MRIKSLLQLGTLAIALVFAVLASRIAYLELQAYRTSLNWETGVRLVSAALSAMEKVSLERAPSNGLIGDPHQNQPELRAALDRARAESDLAIGRLKALVEADAGDRNHIVSRHLAAMTEQLRIGRSNVDALANRPAETRQPTAINEAVRNMIRVVAEIGPAVLDLSSETERADPALSNFLEGAYLAADLREQAGQLGSLITAPVATKQKLNDSELQEIDRLQGRIEVLHELLEQRVQQYIDKPDVVQAGARMDAGYFREGLAFIERTIELGRKNIDYGMTTSEFAARYVPSMASILSLRDSFLVVASDQAKVSRERAGKVLLGVAAGYVLLLAILALLLFRLGRRVIHAFATTTGIIVAIADGRLETEVPASTRRDEIGEMLRSIQVLKDGMMKQRQMEIALRRSAEITSLLAAIVESSDDAIIGKSLEGVVTSWNQGAERLYGYAKDEAIGRPVSFLSPPGHEDDTAMILDRVGQGDLVEHYETFRRRKDGANVLVSLTVSPIKDSSGRIVGASAIARDVSEKKRAEQEREKLIAELQEALANVKTLSGLIPICASCKKIRDDRGYWNQIENYLKEHSEAEFSHGICPDCAQRLYPEVWAQISEKKADKAGK